jgi:GTPase SAR1 family protein/DNA-binding Xre family transcriptional regulator
MAPRGKRSLKASPNGIEQAEAALVHLAQSKTVLADKLEISRASIHKFFAGQPVGYENFLKICGELKLSWQKIAELPQVEITEFKSDSSAADSQDYPTEPDPNFVGRESANTESCQEEGVVDSKFESQAIQARIEKILEDQANISREKLFGVEEYIAILRKYLQDKEGSWFISVVGSGGVGKTSVVEKLVREHTVESGFVDIAWVTAKRTYFFVENRSIRDIGTALNIDALISEIAEQLYLTLPPIVDDHFFCLQNHLRAKPCLIIIDNLETLKDYTDLMEKFNPNSQKNNLRPSKLLFTSRVKIQKLSTQVREVELKGIDVNPTLELIRYKGAHIQRIKEALDEELLPIFYATNGIPLLVLLVVSLIATDDSTLDEIIQSLLKQEELYKYLYEESLNSISDNAFKVLTSMTDFSESIPVTRQQLRQQAELGDDEFKEAVGECIERCLLTSISKSLSDEPRYSIHNLLYEFLRDLPTSE